MKLYELIIIAVCLAMDAFAVSVCKGATSKKINIRMPITLGLYFGCFQGLMPIIGYILGIGFISKIEKIDHFIILIILLIIGLSMIKESKKADDFDEKIDIKTMLMLSIATSLDAMSIGITFTFIEIPIIYACLIIAIITFILSAIGVYIGSYFGKKYKSISCITGGIILIVIGIKIFLEHMGIL